MKTTIQLNKQYHLDLGGLAPVAILTLEFLEEATKLI